MEAKIFDGVPIPEDKRAGAPKKYPFDKMKPGQHFIWTCKPGENVQVRRSSIWTAAQLRGYKVKTRSDGNLIRCWMVGRING